MRVHDAGDLPPTVPFWLGEAPARTAELSEAVSDLRAALEPLLRAGDGDGARRLVRRTRRRVRRGGPTGGGLLRGRPGRAGPPAHPGAHRGRALLRRQRGVAADPARALRRAHQPRPRPGAAQALLRLVRLRAAGGGGRRHRRALARPPAQLPADPGAVDAVERQRRRGADPGRAAPPDAGRTLALEPEPGPRAAPHERAASAGPSTSSAWRPTTCWPPCGPGWPPARRTRRPDRSAVPDHVLARQTVDDCLHEGLSVEGLVDVWSQVESGAIEVHTVESSEPSPFSHGILSGRPFTFLDGAPLEERRTRALSLRRGLGELGPDGLPVPADELDALDPDAVAMVLEQVRPRAAQRRRAARPAALPGGGPPGDGVGALVRRPGGRRPGRPGRRVLGGHRAPTRRPRRLADDDEAAAACVGGHLQLAGPVTVDAAGRPTRRCRPARRWGAPLSPARARTALARLEAQGLGHRAARRPLVRPPPPGAPARRQPAAAGAAWSTPVPIADYVRFLTRWQHVTPATRLEGRGGLLGVIEQLQGIEAPAVGVGGADPPGPGRGLRRPLARRALPLRRGRVGPADPAGRARRAQPGRRRRPRHWPSCVREDLVACCGPCGPGHRRRTRGRRGGRRAGRPARPRGLLPTRAGPADRAAAGRGGRGTVGSGGAGHGDGRCLLRRALPALGPRPLAHPDHRAAGARRDRPGPARRGLRSGSGIGEGRWSLLPVDPRCSARRGDRRRRPRCRATRSWPRRWPGSCWPAGGWWPGRCGAGSPSRCPGARWCGRCGGSRRAASPWAAASWSGSRASSTRCPRRPRSWSRCTAAPPAAKQVVVAGADPLNVTGAIMGGTRVPDPPVPERDLPRRRGGGHPAGRVGPWDRRRLTSMPTSARPTTRSAARWSSTLLGVVTSVHVACGGHAGDEESMRAIMDGGAPRWRRRRGASFLSGSPGLRPARHGDGTGQTGLVPAGPDRRLPGHGAAL